MGSITVINQYLTDVAWLNASACNFSIGNHIDVWKIGVSPNSSLIDSFLTILTPDEIARANRYHQLKDRNRFIISRGAMRHIFGKYLNQTPATVEFGAGENNKPYIKSTNQLNLQYNLSHSGDAILLAVSDSAIGADIEFINKSFGFKEVLADNFSTAEIDYINETDAVACFFRLWTRKEALTKATAQGLDIDLKLIPVLDGSHLIKPGIIASNNNWLIRSFALNDEYTASIASFPFIDKISFWDLDIIMNSPIF
ncbi:4'-phosphopantetheinyl transferase family protein [Mucilaginibacter sp. OK098]|uniref:4'-phosphopantetheinyl transferase family protein n=1 Tax=Mucilaginibacter sp. OK098 TaxID=1855297 RepID=UPI000914485D|nr:4'-phosphopantetheinyl transferase superfamily protein [Mucilaginibacter sp. OK098]SHM21946.1 4'-phosphopantetheinyl transferase [Mucilaginibacter sp. OK098]